jgi:hypothetical protein
MQVIDINNSGGEAGIRTLGTGISQYNGLANRRIRPLCHLSVVSTLACQRFLGHFSVDHAPDAQGVAVSQLVGQN